MESVNVSVHLSEMSCYFQSFLDNASKFLVQLFVKEDKSNVFEK